MPNSPRPGSVSSLNLGTPLILSLVLGRVAAFAAGRSLKVVGLGDTAAARNVRLIEPPKSKRQEEPLLFKTLFHLLLLGFVFIFSRQFQIAQAVHEHTTWLTMALTSLNGTS